MRRTPVLVAYMVLLSISISLMSGCAVLTSSQVKEVKRFSQASDAYTELPGSLARSYGELLRDGKLLDFSLEEFSTNDPKLAKGTWSKLTAAYDSEQKFSAVGNRLNEALNVLRIYSEFLGQLVSDDYTDALGESSTHLGKSLKEATDTYNSNYRKDNPLPSINVDIAGAIRLTGGLFLRHRQTKILRKTIIEANPLVQGLMSDVKELSNVMVIDYKHFEDQDLRIRFENVANENRRLPVTTYEFVYNDLSRARAGQELAKKVGGAATTFASAHQALVDNTRVRMNLKGVISQIQALRNEVSAAKAVEADLEK